MYIVKAFQYYQWRITGLHMKEILFGTMKRCVERRKEGQTAHVSEQRWIPQIK
jgi:hypothetical protein